MKIEFALLCDHASVREGMLTLVSAGVDVINRPSYPAPLGIMFAALISLEPGEIDREHQIELRLTRDTGTAIASLSGGFQVVRSDAGPRSGRTPIVADLRNMIILEPGRYGVTVLLDSRRRARIDIDARLIHVAQT